MEQQNNDNLNYEVYYNQKEIKETFKKQQNDAFDDLIQEQVINRL